jgi:Protein of unknown function DUF262
MNALRYSLKQLLTAHRDRKFVVPNYQREYEWETPSEGKGEVGQFWEDIWHNCWKAGRKHFLGVILVDERGADSELVDGQQRVTTMFLLVLALRNLFNYVRDVDSKAVELARQVWSYVSKLFDEDDLRHFLSVFVLRHGNQTPGGGLYEELRFEFVQAQEARELVPWLKGFERSALNYQRILEPGEDSTIDRLLLELKQLSVPSLAPLLLMVLDCVDNTDCLEQMLMTLCSLVVRTAVVYERPATKFQQLMVEAGNCFDPMHKVNRADAQQKLEQLVREFWIQDERFGDRFALRPLFGPGSTCGDCVNISKKWRPFTRRTVLLI